MPTLQNCASLKAQAAGMRYPSASSRSCNVNKCRRITTTLHAFATRGWISGWNSVVHPCSLPPLALFIDHSSSLYLPPFNCSLKLNYKKKEASQNLEYSKFGAEERSRNALLQYLLTFRITSARKQRCFLRKISLAILSQKKISNEKMGKIS